MKYLPLLLVALIFTFGCQDSKTASDDKKVEQKETVKANTYKLTPFTPSQGFSDASITSMTYKSGKFNFGIGGSAYQLGVQTPDAPQKNCANSGKGQHIHLIVNNEPYAAKYTNEFDYDIPDGDHYLLAFLSRSYHESIKTKEAAVVKKISVKNKSIEAEKPVGSPMVFYSRPKGTYTGAADTKKVMLDFYLANVNMADGYRVKANINGEDHLIAKWQPYYIEGLPMGENTITLTLLDKDNNAVKTALNPVTRKFTLKADPLEKK